MRTSKRKHEGLVTIDHRNSPGLTESVVQHDGTLSPVVKKGQLFESATVTCSHCQTIVILNPLRTRPRNYCQKCDAYVCDSIGCQTCVPFKKIIDDVLEQGVKAVQRAMQRIAW